MFENQNLRKDEKKIETIIKQNRNKLFGSVTSRKILEETPKMMNRSRNMSQSKTQT
jgi:ribosomal protein L9